MRLVQEDKPAEAAVEPTKEPVGDAWKNTAEVKDAPKDAKEPAKAKEPAPAKEAAKRKEGGISLLRSIPTGTFVSV